MSYDAVLFDLDGTLINTQNADFIIERNFLRQYDFSLSQHTYEAVFGQTLKQMIAGLIAASGKDINADEYLQAVEKQLQEATANRPDLTVDGAVDFCQDLYVNGVKLALVTSSARHMVDKYLVVNDIKKFLVKILTADDVSLVKPDPEGYLKAAAELQAKNPVIMEDSLPGIMAAHKSGFPFFVHSHSANQSALKIAQTLPGFKGSFTSFDAALFNKIIKSGT